MGTAVKAVSSILGVEYTEPINELKTTTTFLERNYRGFLEDRTRLCR